MRMIWLVLALAVVSEASWAEMTPEYVGVDERYKVDIMVIVAHPDDEAGDVGGYLARAVFDQHRRVAVLFTTHAEAGPSVVGNEGGRALGAVREIEARQALGHFGITNVWFIGGRHTNSQNVLTSLENTDHGAVLAEAVRLIRLTRPGVIITWLPLPVAGENHADHQAASVIASEAFDLAGDPSAFGEQLYTQQPHDPVGHDAEGLQPWQPEKLFYFTDAFDLTCTCWGGLPQPSPFRRNFLEGVGPAYSNADMSPAKKVSYGRLSAEEASYYISQQGAGDIAVPALARNDLKDFEVPIRFVLGKSLVEAHLTDDIFAGITPGGIPFAPARKGPFAIRREVSLDAGGPWEFYRQFWSAHHLDTVADLLPVPEFSLPAGRRVDIPLIIRNGTANRQSVALTAVLPQGWIERRKYSEFPLPPQSTYSVHSTLQVPSTVKAGWYDVRWTAQSGGRQIGTVNWHIYVTPSSTSGVADEDR